tara:strand:- start:179115 stop:179657 length:543 start_codon:yes stop_codon:yes gene_type:complete
MALGSTIYKVDINLSNFNTHYYQDFNLTMAKHPSEDEARMMYRLLAFLYCAHEDLKFTRGLSTTEEPELWQKDYTGQIIQWIDMGLPDLKRIRQACGKSQSVKVFTYHQNKAQEWYQKNKSDFEKNKKLEVYHFNVNENGPIDKFVKKSMVLSCIIEESHMYLSNDNERIGIEILSELPA